MSNSRWKRAERKIAKRMTAYLGELQRAWPDGRVVAVDAVAEARAALETAVRTGDDVFGAYRDWVQASVALWGVDAELAQMRGLLSKPTRETPMPTFSFTHDVAAIIDRLSAELFDAALKGITERRQRFVNGQESTQ